MTDVLHVGPAAEHIEPVHERRVKQLFKLNVLAELERASTVFVVHFVAGKVLLEMALHVAELLEQIVEIPEQIVEIRLAGPMAAVTTEVGMAHLIVLAPFLRVAKHLVSLGNLTELRLGARLRALVRVVLEGEFAERLLDLTVRRSTIDAQTFVVVFLSS